MRLFDDTLRSWVHTVRVLQREWRGSKLEPEVPLMDRFLSEDSLCVHIGASDGRHALHVARRAPRGVVHCIEPSSYTLNVLRRLARLLGVSNLKFHNLAIGATEGQVHLVTPIKKNGHRGRAFAFISEDPMMRSAADWDRRFTAFQNDPVRLCTLDAFCRREVIERIDFLRCDIEGAEILMLEGGRETLARDRPVIMMEVHPIFLSQRFGRSAEEVRSVLQALDYRFFYLEDGELAPNDAFFDEPWRDYFCVPSERTEEFRLPRATSGELARPRH